ncbi:hypothetical protein BAE44_0022697 [Dichanthelium oligosanthes]|uniref:BPM/SPOP BACK domain-containing protein n=1 Tax=Dichanthelium oligosanthes TaxID=888268 RepID=A0A1E5UTU9_9POAL|nr:hypothetical protein BAE44_0022697 [Dichanthelium oligosanthes]
MWSNMSVDTVANALACAETFNCPELKNKCIDFIVAEKNFKKAVLTEGFMQMGQNFPSIIAESWNKLPPSGYEKRRRPRILSDNPDAKLWRLCMLNQYPSQVFFSLILLALSCSQ